MTISTVLAERHPTIEVWIGGEWLLAVLVKKNVGPRAGQSGNGILARVETNTFYFTPTNWRAIGPGPGFSLACKDGQCKKCYPCYQIYIEKKFTGQIE